MIMCIVLFFVGFLFGITAMAVLFASRMARERGAAQRNTERLVKIARQYYRGAKKEI